jgi:hypothetical protein
MIATIATVLPCSVNTLWQALLKPASLRYITSPILTFVDAHGDGPAEHWETDRPYVFNLYLFGLLPLGRHRITVVTINGKDMKLASNESGSMAPVWNHRIELETAGESSTRYTDTIEIRAGALTFPIWLFAHLFYRHRQRRWRRLLRSVSIRTASARSHRSSDPAPQARRTRRDPAPRDRDSLAGSPRR